jgi:hypothetical protein
MDESLLGKIASALRGMGGAVADPQFRSDVVGGLANALRGGVADMLPANAQERQFQSWIKATPWYSEFTKEYGEPPDLNSKEYDYRAAYRAGVVPQRDPYDNNRYHWASSTPGGVELKAVNHPTAWKEDYMRITGRDPSDPGQPTLTPQQATELSGVLKYRYGK